MSTPTGAEEDDLVFIEETTSPDSSDARANPAVWRVMIIDDDVDVHTATTFALGNIDMQHRPLEFLHAYSAAEARKRLQVERDIAVILLDVVMEQQDAGLQLVRYIREVLALTEVRIILRTGQPGYAPEMDAIRDYDINDYKTKSGLTRIKLFTAVTAAIRSYEQICTINASHRGLDMIVRASAEMMALHGLHNFADGVLTRLAKLLNMSPEGVLCVQEGGDNNNRQTLLVIAATGKFVDLLDRPINECADTRVTGALAQTLSQQRHIYSTDFAALYLAGNNRRDFAVFLRITNALTATDQRMLEVFCSNISVGLDNVMLVTRLHNLAFYDPLTSGPNRTRLKQIIDDTLEKSLNTDATLALVDIDHFAETNDAFGHQFGDLLLIAIAQRLQSRLGKKVTVARAGGDSFALLGDSAQINPTNILAQFDAPFHITGQKIQLSATVGLLRLPQHLSGGADAVKDADIALKRAKLQQRGSHVYFLPSMGIEIRDRVWMMHALRTAFENRQLFVAYQPQIDLITGKSVGAEALLRWKNADGNFISPDRFIPIAEHSGLIIELGEWVLREACRELVKLHRLGHTDFMMSINVSQAQFRHPLFLDTLRSVLHDTSAPPSSIELEITESMAMEEPGLLIKLLAQIKQIGLSIAIDDFGTGFSSLSYLQQLQIDRLKIDRAFVTEITDASRGSSIAEMIIQLGRNLNLKVIAEGVEDERQAAILRGLGCPLAQGYLFARPMAADLLTPWLQNNAQV